MGTLEAIQLCEVLRDLGFVLDAGCLKTPYRGIHRVYELGKSSDARLALRYAGVVRHGLGAPARQAPTTGAQLAAAGQA